MLKLVSHELKAPLNGLAGYTRTGLFDSIPEIDSFDGGLGWGETPRGDKSPRHGDVVCGKMNILLRYL